MYAALKAPPLYSPSEKGREGVARWMDVPSAEAPASAGMT